MERGKNGSLPEFDRREDMVGILRSIVMVILRLKEPESEAFDLCAQEARGSGENEDTG